MSPHETPASPSRIPWWLWPNVLSLDAPLVAVLWQAALAYAHQVRLPPECHAVLGLTVWVVYMLDRTLDGAGPAPKLTTARHAFYRRHRAVFLFGIIPMASALTLWLALTALPEGVLWRGLALGFLVGLYLRHYTGPRRLPGWGTLLICGCGFLLILWLPLPPHHRLFYGTLLLLLPVLATARPGGLMSKVFSKEVFCGFFFAVGCSLSVNFYTLDFYAGPFSPETLAFGVLCALNCMGIACYEHETDVEMNAPSLKRTWPELPQAYPALLMTLGLVTAYAASRRMQPELLLYFLAVIGSTVLLGVVHRMARQLSPELSHVLADAALVAPMLVLLAVNF